LKVVGDDDGDTNVVGLKILGCIVILSQIGVFFGVYPISVCSNPSIRSVIVLRKNKRGRLGRAALDLRVEN
jgi:hypothetical protein